jgi:hypothetical protein
VELTKLDRLIAELFPDGAEYKHLVNVINYPLATMSPKSVYLRILLHDKTVNELELQYKNFVFPRAHAENDVPYILFRLYSFNIIHLVLVSHLMTFVTYHANPPSLSPLFFICLYLNCQLSTLNSLL